MVAFGIRFQRCREVRERGRVLVDSGRTVGGAEWFWRDYCESWGWRDHCESWGWILGVADEFWELGMNFGNWEWILGVRDGFCYCC